MVNLVGGTASCSPSQSLLRSLPPFLGYGLRPGKQTFLDPLTELFVVINQEGCIQVDRHSFGCYG